MAGREKKRSGLPRSGASWRSMRFAKTTIMATIVATQVLGQSHPAPLLLIYRDLIKPGNEIAYQEVERGTARLMREAAPLESEWAIGFPNAYLAVEPLSGPPEIWFLTIWTSKKDYERVGTGYNEAPPSLKSALERNSKRRAELTMPSVSVFAIYRQDLSSGKPWVIGRDRFIVITKTNTSGPFEGSVYESEDRTRYVIMSARSREEADSIAMRNGPESRAFVVRPDLARPAREWVASNMELWEGAPPAR